LYKLLKIKLFPLIRSFIPELADFQNYPQQADGCMKTAFVFALFSGWLLPFANHLHVCTMLLRLPAS